MNLKDLRARKRRLADLSAGLAKEASLWRKCDAPILFVDRQEYLGAIEEKRPGEGESYAGEGVSPIGIEAGA